MQRYVHDTCYLVVLAVRAIYAESYFVCIYKARHVECEQLLGHICKLVGRQKYINNHDLSVDHILQHDLRPATLFWFDRHCEPHQYLPSGIKREKGETLERRGHSKYAHQRLAGHVEADKLILYPCLSAGLVDCCDNAIKNT